MTTTRRLSRRTAMTRTRRLLAVLGLFSMSLGAILGVTATSASAAAPLNGAIYTTDAACVGTNVNLFASKAAVYVNGGPAHPGAAGLADGTYYIKVTEPNGTLLGTSVGAAIERPVVVTGGVFAQCYHLEDVVFRPNHAAGYNDSTNGGGEYKVWVSPDSSFNPAKTDNFKVASATEVTPTGPSKNTACGTADTYTIPPDTGVVYKVGGVTKAAQVYPLPDGTTVSITAEPAAGFAFPAGTQTTWSFTGAAPVACPQPTPVTPAAATKATPCGSSNTYTIPTTTGVIYKVGGTTTAAGTYPLANGTTVDITAEPASASYVIANGAATTWSFTGAAPVACPGGGVGPAVVVDNNPTPTTAPPTTTTSTTQPVLPFIPDAVLGEIEVAPPPTTATTVATELTRSGPQLPLTGSSNSGSMSLIGIALVTIGGFLVIASRGRKPARN